MQNGMLQPWLDAKGLGDNTQVRVGGRSWFASSAADMLTALVTRQSAAAPPSHTQTAAAVAPLLAAAALTVQVLVYFAVAKLGDTPVDGKTDVNPEGLTAGACV
jgi:hypothetical protein